MKAKVIEFEGTDGAGKTTALKYFIGQMRAIGMRVLDTREVGNPHIPVCVQMRETVLSTESGLNGAQMEIVFAAMRVLNQAFYRKVQWDYDFIVSDRGLLSHLAYTDHNVNDEFTDKLYLDLMHDITTTPDAVIYFDVNTETALLRRQARGSGMDAIEIKGVGFQEKVRESFLEHIGDLQRNSPETEVFKVDANQSIVDVQKRMDKILAALLV
jgi:dTMP kinase